MPSVSSGVGTCGRGWGDGFWVLVVDGGKWVAGGEVGRMRLVGRFEARRLGRRVGRDGAMVMVMRLVGGSGLRWCDGNFMVV